MIWLAAFLFFAVGLASFVASAWTDGRDWPFWLRCLIGIPTEIIGVLLMSVGALLAYVAFAF